tara:strand:+ start:1020 stop:1190 length:171 start_codon:yes stop_codon:yes gene_type:complete
MKKVTLEEELITFKSGKKVKAEVIKYNGIEHLAVYHERYYLPKKDGYVLFKGEIVK